MEYAFEDVPESARIIWDRGGAVWVKVGGAWKCAADPDADNSPGHLGNAWPAEDMNSFGPFTVIDVDPSDGPRFGVTVKGPNGTRFTVADSTMEHSIPEWPGASVQLWGI
jgi:hypothetical protein